MTATAGDLDLYRHIHRPAADPAAGTLLLLHGTGGDAASFMGLGAAVAPGWGMLSLEGDVSEMGARRFFRRRAEGVYDMGDLAARTETLARFVEAAIAAHGIDRERLVAIGYSNGANILANLAITRPETVRCHVWMHPLIPWEPRIAAGADALRVTITAGERDPICPAPLTVRLGAAFEAAGARVATHWHAGGHEIREGELDAIRAALG